MAKAAVVKPASSPSREVEAKHKLTAARKNPGVKAGSAATKTPSASAAKSGKIGRATDGGEVTSGAGTSKLPQPELQVPSIASRFTRRIVRPRDLLVLDFTFVNLKVANTSSGKLQLVRRDPGNSAYIVVGFPPQHLLEQAFFETAPETPIVRNSGKPEDPDQKISKSAATGEEPESSDIPVQSRLAESSRLVFRSPSGFTSLPYTLEDVLAACRNWELSVAPTATPPDPRARMVPGLEIASVSAWAASAAQRKRVVTTSAKSTHRPDTTAAKLVAGRAFTAAVVAETRDQWYAQRSPLQRRPAATAEIQEVVDILDTLKVLPQLAPPGINHTAIEAPTRLILSPNSYGAWVHATAPVESVRSGRVELWHTRLAVRAAQGVTEKDDFRRAVRAIWSPDVIAGDAFAPIPHENLPFRAPLDANDRHQIVHLSANHRLFVPDSQPKKRIVPQPIDVDRLMLSSLGAWMNVHGAWSPPPGMSLEEWRNRGTMGRDHYVRVVYAGRLYPFGHRASLIKVTERKFHPGGKTKGNAAFLRQRMFLVVREPYVLLGNTGDVVVNELGNSEQLDLKMPLKSARLGENSCGSDRHRGANRRGWDNCRQRHAGPRAGIATHHEAPLGGRSYVARHKRQSPAPPGCSRARVVLQVVLHAGELHAHRAPARVRRYHQPSRPSVLNRRGGASARTAGRRARPWDPRGRRQIRVGAPDARAQGQPRRHFGGNSLSSLS